MTTEGAEATRRVLRRCAQCRLLFEVAENVEQCIVCGVAVTGLALPIGTLGDDGAVAEFVEREPTSRVVLVPRN
jgi:hypothetical protein